MQERWAAAGIVAMKPGFGGMLLPIPQALGPPKNSVGGDDSDGDRSVGPAAGATGEQRT